VADYLYAWQWLWQHRYQIVHAYGGHTSLNVLYNKIEEGDISIWLYNWDKKHPLTRNHFIAVKCIKMSKDRKNRKFLVYNPFNKATKAYAYKNMYKILNTYDGNAVTEEGELYSAFVLSEN